VSRCTATAGDDRTLLRLVGKGSARSPERSAAGGSSGKSPDPARVRVSPPHSTRRRLALLTPIAVAITPAGDQPANDKDAGQIAPRDQRRLRCVRSPGCGRPGEGSARRWDLPAFRRQQRADLDRVPVPQPSGLDGPAGKVWPSDCRRVIPGEVCEDDSLPASSSGRPTRPLARGSLNRSQGPYSAFTSPNS
jgi:hypothetical protein